MHDRLTRLLAACELLSREETAALNWRAFAALSRTLDLKGPLLAELGAEARRRRGMPAMVRAGISRLLEKNMRNLAVLSASMSEAETELHRMNSAGHQLELLRAAYDVPSEPPPSFSAHG